MEVVVIFSNGTVVLCLGGGILIYILMNIEYDYATIIEELYLHYLIIYNGK
jgi:hypothetical protein